MTWKGGTSLCPVPKDLEELSVWLQPTELVLWKARLPTPIHLYTAPHLSHYSQSLHSLLPGRALETGLASHGCVWGALDHCIQNRDRKRAK